MPLARRHRRPGIDIWPGFVDALSQLLMVIIFVLLIFTGAQFFLVSALSGRDAQLSRLNRSEERRGRKEFIYRGSPVE